jgi:hypothetical protein
MPEALYPSVGQIMNSFSINGLPGLFGIPWLIGAWFVLNCILILMLAVAVMKDAEARQRNAVGLFLIGPWFWFFIVLVTGGYLPALAYWLIHYSALRYRRE